jgi:hypothetical protein
LILPARNRVSSTFGFDSFGALMTLITPMETKAQNRQALSRVGRASIPAMIIIGLSAR